jgi:integrase/recombinase XerD
MEDQPAGAAQSLSLAPAAIEAIGSDQELVKLWLAGLSRHTQRAYRHDSNLFFAFVGKALRSVQFTDVQAFADHLATLRLVAGSRGRAMSAIKSLCTFGVRVRYLQFNVAQPLRLPPSKDTLNERILDLEEVRLLITGETGPRNRVILQLLYVAGVRVSELAALSWRDVQDRRSGGQITVFGKGGKTRSIKLEGPIWPALLELRGTASDNAPVFPGRRGRHLHESQVLRIVKAAAKRVGITKPVSPHWLRHCHASHALDRGAPIHLVQQTLGHSSVATTSRYLHARPSESSSKFLPSV